MSRTAMSPIATRVKTLILSALVSVLAAAAGAQSLAGHAGYADLSHFEHVLGDDVTFDVDFDRESLAALMTLAGSDDERLAAIVDSVESVRARAFNVATGDADAVRQGLADTAAQLGDRGWSTLASVLDGEKRLEVLLRLQGDRIAGVTALFLDGDEAGYANVVGDVGMAEVMALAPGLSSLRGFLGEIRDLGDRDG